MTPWHVFPLHKERMVPTNPLDGLDPLDRRQPSDPQVESHHTFPQLVLAPYTSPGTREDYPLVFTSPDPPDCAAGPVLDFHTFIWKTCRVDFSLTVGTSTDHRAGTFATLLKFLSTPYCPKQTGPPHIPFFALLWGQAYTL